MLSTTFGRNTLSIGAAALLAACGGLGQAQNGAQPPLGAPSSAHAAAHFATSSERVLYSFTGGSDGGDPAADLVFDGTGKLYGTTVVGGDASCGTIFTLTPRSSPPWKESVLYSFTCYSDGKNPYGGVVYLPPGAFGGAQLFGTTVSGGAGPCDSTGCGVAFERRGHKQSVLHDFAGGTTDGFGPGNGLALPCFCQLGSLFGVTPDGGKYSQGVVYELYLSHSMWHESVLHAFTGGNDGGGGMLGRLAYDNAGGNIYGVTETGGAYGAGTIYRLTPTAKGKAHFATLYAFKGTPDCGSPYGGLTEDAKGNLYGTTYYGGSNGAGCIYELNAHASYAEKVLYSFKGGSDGSNPTGTLTLVEANHVTNLFGTTSMGGGSCNCGTIFSLKKKTDKETVRHVFTGGSDGAYPYYALAKDTAGNLYGTTAAGGTSNQGTVFELAKP